MLPLLCCSNVAWKMVIRRRTPVTIFILPHQKWTFTPLDDQSANEDSCGVCAENVCQPVVRKLPRWLWKTKSSPFFLVQRWQRITTTLDGLFWYSHFYMRIRMLIQFVRFHWNLTNDACEAHQISKRRLSFLSLLFYKYCHQFQLYTFIVWLEKYLVEIIYDKCFVKFSQTDFIYTSLTKDNHRWLASNWRASKI